MFLQAQNRLRSQQIAKAKSKIQKFMLRQTLVKFETLL